MTIASPHAQAADNPTATDAMGTAWVPGSCGELLQGQQGERQVLMSAPVERGVRARVRLSNRPGIRGLADAPRASRMLAGLLARFGEDGASVHLEGNLPRGKGMASSTADLVAVAAAGLRALGRTPSSAELARQAVAIEPSDSVMYPGLVLMDRDTGQCLQAAGPAPSLPVIALDFGGTVDTLAFSREDHRIQLRGNAAAFEEAVAAVMEGLAHDRPDALGHGITLSARLHQAILPKPALPAVEKLAPSLGALGVNVAHSGSLIGMLMPDDPARVTFARQRLQRHFGGSLAIAVYRLGGGFGSS